jgi:hypothetical protein
MTGPPPLRNRPPTRSPHTSNTSTADRTLRARRWLALHRRAVSAAFAFISVLFAVGAVAPSRAESPSTASGSTTRAIADEGMLEVPVRLADPPVTSLLAAGDVIDVMGTAARGSATVVADELLVLSVPDTGGDSAWSSGGDGFVVLAATPTDALALAGAASQGPLTVAVHP